MPSRGRMHWLVNGIISGVRSHSRQRPVLTITTALQASKHQPAMIGFVLESDERRTYADHEAISRTHLGCDATSM